MKLQLLFLISLMLLFNKIDSYSQKTSLLSNQALNDTAISLKKMSNTDSLSYKYFRSIPIVFIHPNEKGDGWITEQKGNWSIVPELSNIYYRMIKEIGEEKNIFFAIFLDSEKQYNFREVFGYTENGKDVFLDRHFRKYNSLNAIIKKRYGSVKRYKEIYKIFNTLTDYGDNMQTYSKVRIITQTKADKEIRANAKKKFLIWGVNITESDWILKRDPSRHFLLCYFDKKKVVIFDDNRREIRTGNLKKMKNFYFYAHKLDDYNGGHCNE